MTPGIMQTAETKYVGSEPYLGKPVGVVLEVEREEWYEARY